MLSAIYISFLFQKKKKILYIYIYVYVYISFEDALNAWKYLSNDCNLKC